MRVLFSTGMALNGVASWALYAKLKSSYSNSSAALVRLTPLPPPPPSSSSSQYSRPRPSPRLLHLDGRIIRDLRLIDNASIKFKLNANRNRVLSTLLFRNSTVLLVVGQGREEGSETEWVRERQSNAKLGKVSEESPPWMV